MWKSGVSGGGRNSEFSSSPEVSSGRLPWGNNRGAAALESSGGKGRTISLLPARPNRNGPWPGQLPAATSGRSSLRNLLPHLGTTAGLLPGQQHKRWFLFLISNCVPELFWTEIIYKSFPRENRRTRFLEPLNTALYQGKGTFGTTWLVSELGRTAQYKLMSS